MSKPLSMSDTQLAAAERALAELEKMFPGLERKQLVAGPLAELAYGPLPHYSQLATHNILDVDTSTDGSFVICYGTEPHTGERVAVIIERSEKGPKGESRYGVTGGYMNIHSVFADERAAKRFIPGEQPALGAGRELSEELLNDRGEPILALDPKRFCLITSGIDYSGAMHGGLPSHYTGFAVELTPEEIRRVQKHVFRLRTDPAYKDAVRIQSHNEVLNVIVMPLRAVAAMDDENFTHPHELEAARELYRLLAEEEPGIKNVFSLRGKALLGSNL